MPPGDPRANLVRALADGAARAFAAGDSRAARVALAALSGLVDDAPDAAPGNDAAVVNLATERRQRGDR